MKLECKQYLAKLDDSMPEDLVFSIVYLWWLICLKSKKDLVSKAPLWGFFCLTNNIYLCLT